jgi:diguanylate cyclase (GGDEF)-like protein/PAS domain S-box-containing protein
MTSERAASQQRDPPPQDSTAGGGDARAPFDALAALRESEARFRSLCELSSDWYWEQDADLRFTVISGSITNKGNFRISNAIGKRRWELPVERDGTDWAGHQAMVEAHLPFKDFEYRIQTEDGSWRYYSARGEPLFTSSGEFAGYRGVANDITQRKQSEQALRRFRAAMDTSADSILLIDRAAMRVIDANTTTCEVLGCSRQEVLAMTPQTLFPSSNEQLELAYDELIAGAATVAPSLTTLRRKDGSLLPVEVSWRAIMSGDGWNIVGIVRDISARITAEQTIRRHAMQQGLIAAFGQHALANSDLDDLLRQAANVVIHGLDVEFGAVFQLAPDKSALVLRAGVGWERGWDGSCVAEVGDGARGNEMLALSQPLIVDDFESASSSKPSLIQSQHGVRSSASVPIHGVSGLYGVLNAGAGQPVRFSQESVNFLKSLANTLATAMDRKDAEQRLAYLAQFDTLTGLANRSLFLDRFDQTLKHAQRNEWMVGVLFIDLDRFKIVNDTLGHAAGDELLVKVGERLQQCVRADDSVGRLGGDEFAFVLARLARPDDAALVAQKVVAELARPFMLEGQEIYISASLGIGIYPSDGSTPDTLLRNADTAMYRAKERGRNGYQFYLPRMNEQARERMQLQMQLRGAQERDELVLHYQPKVCLASGRISGFEALLRWQHPTLGLVPPRQFINILEETGLIVQVGEWVVRTVCEQLARWQSAGVKPRPVAINLSARQFQQSDLDTAIATILADTGIDPSLLEFELTESVLMSDADEAVRVLNAMRSYGVRLSIDDFGTGYSSLAYLKRFPIDALKIDRTFISDLTTDSDDGSIALAIISLAHSLKLKVIAEGVETRDQLEFLRAHGCDEMQGYYFARPLSIVDCTRALVERWRLPTTKPSPRVATG